MIDSFSLEIYPFSHRFDERCEMATVTAKEEQMEREKGRERMRMEKNTKEQMWIDRIMPNR